MSSWHLAKVFLHVLSTVLLAFLAISDGPSAQEQHNIILCLLWHYLALNAMETGKAVYEVFI